VAGRGDRAADRIAVDAGQVPVQDEHVVGIQIQLGSGVRAAIAISARSSDVRVAGQLSLLASLPSVAVTTLLALNVIRATLGLALGAAALLLVLDTLGWRITSATFDRERLITGTR
jgi:hypothetical protein